MPLVEGVENLWLQDVCDWLLLFMMTSSYIGLVDNDAMTSLLTYVSSDHPSNRIMDGVMNGQ